MKMLDFLCVIAGVVAMFWGIRELKTGKLNDRKMSQYTEESVKAFVPISALLYIIAGIGLELMGFSCVIPFIPTVIYLIGIILFFGSTILETVLAKKKLIIRDNRRDNTSK